MTADDNATQEVLHFNAKDHRGVTYGELTGVRPLRIDGRLRWEWLCSCGRSVVRNQGDVMKGTTRSCGHLTAANNRKHGLEGSAIYNIWSGIKKRCHSPGASGYERYGARGIQMHPEWRSDVAAFASYMGERPSPKHSVDRIDNDGHYEPGNVRWATMRVQSRNKTTTLRVNLDGESVCLKDACERLGLDYQLLRGRVGRLGWDFERARTTPHRRTGCLP